MTTASDFKTITTRSKVTGRPVTGWIRAEQFRFFFGLMAFVPASIALWACLICWLGAAF